MSAYFIVEIKIKDEAKNKQTYAQYVAGVRVIVEKYSGRYLSRGGKITPIFGGWIPERVIIIEFPSTVDVKKWLNSPEYQEISGLRESSTFTKAIIVEGC